jgi:hypothetical protein
MTLLKVMYYAINIRLPLECRVDNSNLDKHEDLYFRTEGLPRNWHYTYPTINTAHDRFLRGITVFFMHLWEHKTACVDL